MSDILGLQQLRQKLTTFEVLTRQGVEDMMRAEVEACKREVLDLVPVDTGQLKEALSSSDAIKESRSRDTGGLALAFGFNTTAQKKMDYYGFWVEFGTKAYDKGARRDAGVDKHGRKRKRRIKRRVPARRAQPFFRPAVANLIVRMKRARQFQAIVAAAKTGAELADRS